jgi:hypothetical protein
MRMRSRRRIRFAPVDRTLRTHPVIQFFMFAVHFLALTILSIMFAPAAAVYAALLVWGLVRRASRRYHS